MEIIKKSDWTRLDDERNGIKLNQKFISEMEGGKNYVFALTDSTNNLKLRWIERKILHYAKRENKKVLIISSNSAKMKQCEILFHKFKEFLDVKTYKVYENSLILNLDKYDIIICDDFHYFFNDLKFNENVNESFNKITNASKPIKIFMSNRVGKLINDYKSSILNIFKSKNGVLNIEKLFYADNERMYSNIKNVIVYDVPKTKYLNELFRNINSRKDAFKKIILLSSDFKQLFNIYHENKNICTFVSDKMKNDREYASFIKDGGYKKRFLLANCSEYDFEINESVDTIVFDNVHDINFIIGILGKIKHNVNILISNMTSQQVNGKKITLTSELSLVDGFEDEKSMIKAYKLKTKNMYLNSNVIGYNTYDNKICLKHLNVLEREMRLEQYGIMSSLNKNEKICVYNDVSNEHDIVNFETKAHDGFAKYLEIVLNREVKRVDISDVCIEIGGEPIEDDIFKNINLSKVKTKRYSIRATSPLNIYLEKLYENNTILLSNGDKQPLLDIAYAQACQRSKKYEKMYKNMKTAKTLNGFLFSVKCKYFIEQFETSRIVNGKRLKYKTAWRVKIRKNTDKYVPSD